MDIKKFDDQAKPETQDENLHKTQKPITGSRNAGLSILLIFAFVYNGLLLLVMIAGLFFANNVQKILQQYYKQTFIPKSLSLLVNSAATILLGISFYGLILLWRFKKKGFYYFASAQVVILLTLFFFLQSTDWINFGVVISILIILGISSRNMK